MCLERFLINLENKTFEITMFDETFKKSFFKINKIKGYKPCELTKDIFSSIKSLKNISKKIKKIDIDIHGNGYSVAFAIPRKGILVWMDFDKDLSAEWNQYIFSNTDEKDQLIKQYQDACTSDGYPYNYANCQDLGVEALSQIFGD